MAAWKLAPALAAGNCVVLKPAEQTPASIMVLMELIGDLLPAGVLNVVNGFGARGGQAARLVGPHRQDRLHRRDDDRPADHAVRLREPDPGDARARRQVAQHLLRRRDGREDDAFFDKAIEGFVLFALNQGEVCTCPSRALIQRRSTTASWSARSPGSKASSRAIPRDGRR
jgi:aldehyde dehydrogenase